MTTDRSGPTAFPAWHALAAHFKQMRDRHVRSLFADDPSRGQRFVAEAAGLYLDYSKNRITVRMLHIRVRCDDGQ